MQLYITVGKRCFGKIIPLFCIRTIDFNNSTEKALHDRMIALTDKILFNKQANPESDTTALERGIDATVYKLYGLTPEEIEIVERKNS